MIILYKIDCERKEVMRPSEFINKADISGGPERMFDMDYSAADIDAETDIDDKFKDVVADYWMAYMNMREFRDRYYHFVEKGYY